MEGLSTHALLKDVMMGISGAVRPPTLTRIRATPFVQKKMCWFKHVVAIPMVPCVIFLSSTITGIILIVLLKDEEIT